MSVRPDGGRPRRTWPQRLLIVFNSFAIVAALGSAGVVAYGKKTVSDISRISIAGPGVQPPSELEPGDPQNFLIVGVDSDEGLAADDPVRGGRDGTVDGLRSDTIMVVRVDPKAGKARILSFPRDLWVDIPGHGRNRINSAVTYGKGAGPSLLIHTLKANFDIDINHYVQVNFAGFKSIVSQIDGVKVYLSHPIRDGNSRLNQPESGCVTLDADQALAYSRSRHLEYQDEDGRWRSDGSSDLARISRQQDFTRRLIRQALEKGATNPVTLRRMVDSTVKFIKLDDSTTAKDLIDLGLTFRDFDPDELLTFALPVTDTVRGGAAVLDLIEAKAEPILANFRGTGPAGGATAELDPADVTVRVLNGTGKQNQGALTTEQLAAIRFDVRSPGNDTSAHYSRTEVHYRPGDEGEAVFAARYLAADPILVVDATVEEVTVITGDDLTSVRSQPRPADAIELPSMAPTTGSTAPSSTTPAGGVSETTDLGSATTTPTKNGAFDPAGPQGFLPSTPPDGSSCG